MANKTPTQQPQKTGNRAHTQDEMELALQRLARVGEHLMLLPDDDDPLAVFGDVIAEVLEKRLVLASVTNFMQQWLATHATRR
jgi:hypothetical protein